MIAAPPPVPRVGLTLPVAGRPVDLDARVLVAGVVPVPRFGREDEVVATARERVAAGADLVDVSLSPRLVGPVVRDAAVPVVARARTTDEAAALARAGAAVVLVAPDLLAEVLDAVASGALGDAHAGVVVDDLGELPRAGERARAAGVPLAFDATGAPPGEATAWESSAVTAGARLICTTDVRLARRVAEVLAAVLGARREDAP